MTTNITELPLYSDPIFSYDVDLEGANRTLEFRWNTRDSSWHFSVINDDGVIVFQGVKLVVNFPITVDYQLEGKGISGYFALVDVGDFPSNKLSTSPEALPQWYRLFYAYEIEG